VFADLQGGRQLLTLGQRLGQHQRFCWGRKAAQPIGHGLRDTPQLDQHGDVPFLLAFAFG